MKISVHNQLFLFSFLLIAGNAILGNAVYNSDQKVIVADRWVQHTEQVIDQSNRIYLTSRDIETAYRGYVIAKDTAFTVSLNNSAKVIFVYLGQLKQLTRDNDIQQNRVDELVLNLRHLLVFSFKAVKLRRDKGFIPAVSYISAKEGKQYTAEIKVISDNITQEERRLLVLRKQVYADNLSIYHKFLMCIFILMGLFAVLLLVVTGKYLFQSKEKKKHAAELVIANKELLFQNEEKGKRASELFVANNELIFQNKEKGKRAAELVIANHELSYQNDEKENRASELAVANAELLYQNDEKENRAAELVVANTELLYQNKEKENRAAELVIANAELLYQNDEKENRAAELVVANKELLYQNQEKENRAAELVIANAELLYQNDEKEKREMERTKMVKDLIARNSDLEQFAYIISHNLRAPVANIIGASGAIIDAELSMADKEILISGINTSVIKLDSVVKDLNHVLEVKAEINTTKEIVHFSTLTKDIKLSIKNLINRYNIEIQCDFSELNEFITIRAYLYSIFYNLISNSIKYRRVDVPCIIKIKSTLKKNKLEFIFEDNGMGIDLKKNGNELFGLYRRFHANIEGKGMGLYMVKTQVETLGGKIHIQSKVNSGTKFTIEFVS